MSAFDDSVKTIAEMVHELGELRGKLSFVTSERDFLREHIRAAKSGVAQPAQATNNDYATAGRILAEWVGSVPTGGDFSAAAFSHHLKDRLNAEGHSA